MEVMKALEDMVTGHEFDALKEIFASSTGTGAERMGPAAPRTGVSVLEGMAEKHNLVADGLVAASEMAAGVNPLLAVGDGFVTNRVVEGKTGLVTGFEAAVLGFAKGGFTEAIEETLIAEAAAHFVKNDIKKHTLD